MAETAPVRSFAQAALTEDASNIRLRSVQVDGLVLMKVQKHCTEGMPQLVTGLLLGLNVGSTLEVTNCFPFPTRLGEEEEEADGASYQLDMMRNLREVNVDNNTVGWYQSTLLGSYQTLELIETFLSYQENIKHCVCLIHDPYQTHRGSLGVKAVRLTAQFMELYRANSFEGKALRDKNLTWADIFEEIPIRIANSALVSAFMSDLQPKASATQSDFDRLSLSTHPFLERNLEMMIEAMDDLSAEQQRFQYYNRSVQRQQQQQGAWLQKRRAENASRRAAGEEPLPEEDPSNPIFKPIPEPSRIDMYLITNQAANHCTQVNGFSGPSFNKMYLMDALHKE